MADSELIHVRKLLPGFLSNIEEMDFPIPVSVLTSNEDYLVGTNR